MHEKISGCYVMHVSPTFLNVRQLQGEETVSMIICLIVQHTACPLV